MKTIVPFLLLLAAMPAPLLRAQFPSNPAADRVLGASDFDTVGAGLNNPSGLDRPAGIAVDPTTGKLFVASQSDQRILRFASATALANGANAEAVLGQVNFSSTGFSSTQSTFSSSLLGIHVDRQGRLWVADRNNNRVVMFQGASTLSNGAPADLVLGQANFTNSASGTTASTMTSPAGVFVDASDNVWVSDFGNSRVLKFTNASTLTNGSSAIVALGQANFTSGTPSVSSTRLNAPSGLLVDSAGSLWVADQGNNRVVRFDNAATLATGAAASAVLGQLDFDSLNEATASGRFDTPMGIALDSFGTLYVQEYENHRVSFFKNPSAKANGAAADGVIGQPDFATFTSGISSRKIFRPFIGMTFDLSGNLWLSDSNNDRVLRFSPDRTKPILKVTTRVPKTVTKGSLPLKGSASDSSGISRVRSRTGSAAFANAKGTTSWSAKAKLKKGRNRIEIIATDTVGNDSVTKRITVTRE